MTALATPQQSFIADGFADDCDELRHQCLQETPVTFKVFCKIYRKMQMSCIYHDRHSGAEIAELSEEVINIGKFYMLANTSNFEETVVGLFLVYALVTTQPFPNFAYMRLVAEDVPLVERIEQVARREKRMDVLYVLGRLLVEYTRYHAAARERGMEATYRKYVEGSTTADALGLRPKGVFLRQNEELEIIKELSGLQVRYDAAKADMKALKYTDAKLPAELDTSLRNLISGIVNDGDEDMPTVARTIKEKAMKNKVDGMHHLIAVNERSPTKRNSAHKTDIKSSPGKLKTGTQKRQRKIVLPKKKSTVSKKRKRTEFSDDDEESDESNDSAHDCESADIDIKFFDKPAEDMIEIDSRNIKFEELPAKVTCWENGQSYEIEVIDAMESTDAKTHNTRSQNKAVKDSIVESPELQKRKRKQKKPVLKSRFKDMGIDNE